MTNPALVEVPALVDGGWVAEASIGCGMLRFSGQASPQWAAQIIRELARC